MKWQQQPAAKPPACCVVGAAGGEAAGRGCVVGAAGGEAAGCGFVVKKTDAAPDGEAGGRGVVGAAGGEAGGLPNYFATIDRLTGVIDVAHLSELCAGVVWDAIERYRQHARQVMREAFPKASFLRLCFRRSIKEIELAWDLPTGRAVTFDRLLEALHWCFPACSIRARPEDWEVIVAAPLADLKFYWKEQPTDLAHNLIRCEAVLRNYHNGETPRYRKQINRALKLFSRRHPEMLAPTGVRFSSAVELARRVTALAQLVAEEYLSTALRTQPRSQHGRPPSGDRARDGAGERVVPASKHPQGRCAARPVSRSDPDQQGPLEAEEAPDR